MELGIHLLVLELLSGAHVEGDSMFGWIESLGKLDLGFEILVLGFALETLGNRLHVQKVNMSFFS